MLIRHNPRWEHGTGPVPEVPEFPNPCTHINPDGSRCKIDDRASGPDAGVIHVWENAQLLVPVKGTRYLVTYRDYGNDPTWPHNPPRQTLGTFYDDDMILSRDVICLDVNNRPTTIPKADILAMVDDNICAMEPDWLARESSPPRCRARMQFEDQMLMSQCKLGPIGHGERHCAISVTGTVAWWRGRFSAPNEWGIPLETSREDRHRPPKQKRRSIWAKLLGR